MNRKYVILRFRLLTELSDLIRYMKQRYFVFLSRHCFSYLTCIGKTNNRKCSFQRYAACNYAHNFIITYKLELAYNSYNSRDKWELCPLHQGAGNCKNFELKRMLILHMTLRFKVEANEPGYTLTSLT